MLTRKKIIGAKTETTQNTAVSLAETNFLHAYDIDMNPKVEELERKYGSASLDPFASLRGKRWYEPKFKTDLKGSGTAGTAPPIGPLLQACGFTETVVSNTSVTYASSSTAAANFFGPGKSCTIKSYQDGILHAAAGCIGTLRLNILAAKIAICEWSFKGLWAAVTDAAFPTNTPDSSDPMIVQSSSLLLSAYAATISKLEIDLGNQIADKDDVNAAYGLGGFVITDRVPVGSVDPEALLVATHDFYGKFASGAAAQTSIVIGSGAGKICTITLPKTQYGEVKPGDRSGNMTYEIPLKFSRSTGDDVISLVFT
jgi:hypothetical protein